MSIVPKEIKVEITWRLGFYFIYLMLVWILISLAIVDHYEDRIFMIAVWLAFVMSYPLSLFLIQRKESV